MRNLSPEEAGKILQSLGKLMDLDPDAISKGVAAVAERSPNHVKATNWIGGLCNGNFFIDSGFHMGLALAVNHPELAGALWSMLGSATNDLATSVVDDYIKERPLEVISEN